MGNTHQVCIFSDVHFNNHHGTAWQAFRKWHHKHKPTLTVALGDIVDLGAISRYDQGMEDEAFVVPQIQMAVKELNSISTECGRLIMIPGNHEERWEKALFGSKAMHLKGTIGLSLREQFYSQGLNPSVDWVTENSECPGLFVAKNAVLIRHGHRSAGSWGVKNVASTLLTQYPTISTVVGHHHRAQLGCRTVLGKTVFGIANPHLSGTHGYAGASPDWQRGFTVLEFYGRSRLRECELFTPYIVVMDDRGRFSWKGEIYE